MNYTNQNEYEINYNQEIYQQKQEDVQEEINVNIRLGFIRKVIGILTVQLLFTTLFSLWCMNSTSVKIFLITHRMLYYLVIFLELVIIIVMICCRGITRMVPINYLLLAAFTILESYIVGLICAFSNPQLVFMATCMTLIITIFLAIYAMTTSTDFTTKGSILFLFSGVLFCLILFNFFFRMKILHIIICCICVLIAGFYIIYDIQIIVGNKRQMLEVDDYILGSFFLYVDIINLFLYLLSCLNSSSN